MKYFLYSLALIFFGLVCHSCGGSRKETEATQSLTDSEPPSPQLQKTKQEYSSLEAKTPGSVSGNYYNGDGQEVVISADNSINYSLSQANTSTTTTTNIPTYNEHKQEQQSSVLQQSMQRMLVQTGFIEYKTTDPDAEYEKVNAALVSSGGYISNETQRQLHNGVRQEITLRMPADKFMSVVNDIKTGIGKFEKLDIVANDVTEEFLDISARLKTKKEMEERFRTLLLKAAKISEILEIEREINALREEIESTEGRMRFLSNQAQFSTLAVVFYTELEPEEIKKVEENRFLKALKNGWEGVVEFLLLIIKLWPLVILILGTLYLVRSYLRKHDKKMRERAPSAAD